MVKRDREDTEVEALALANCLMLLSRVGESTDSPWLNHKSRPTERMFACKTCNREFSSFQALGGHRASHKKPKLSGDLFHLGRTADSSPAKPKTHECAICGLEFPLGQALGGHMRRHRAAMAESLATAEKPVPVLKKSNSKRVMCLDLNSSPTEDDLTLRLGKAAPPLVLDLVL
ncbi:hypothetical protein EUGRSUZ_B02399 [Eucalyptus grandis]|uniref:C2H2-type zinc finger protein 3 n=2 Tax=Eucalyptus grandis TaxID=71139 RepID=M9YYG3_EUCGR|nr:C2H2-type zinc finger protein 3 [Eucalyptus grandis]KAK3442176.1 hypothetical protein EUGRSUZ_B02399 [Eucalyptus grandis]